MSLHPQAFCAVPEETVRVARAAYPKGNVYLQVRDELGTIYTDQSFAESFPNCGQPAEAPWRLLLVSLMQFAEGLICSARGFRRARTTRLEMTVGLRTHRSRL